MRCPALWEAVSRIATEGRSHSGRQVYGFYEISRYSMINKLLITCLQRNKRLIIPELGAFIRKNIDGVGVILVFVPFLKKDDGVLLSAIESWAGIEADDAMEILKEYVSQIKNSLDTRGQYVIEGVGVLKYDANRVIYLAKPNEAAPAHQRVLERETESREEAPKAQPSARDKSREEVLGELAASVNRIVSRSEQEASVREERVERPAPRRDYDEAPQEHRPHGGDDYGRRSPIQQGSVGSSFYNPSAPSQPAPAQPVGGQMGYMTYGGPQGMPSSGQPPVQPQPSAQQPIGRAQQRERHRESLYGNPSSQGQGAAKPTAPASGRVQGRRRPGGKQPAGGAGKKGGNTVFYVAIIALILAVGVVLYGFIFGNETPLDNQLMMEHVTDNTTDIPITE